MTTEQLNLLKLTPKARVVARLVALVKDGKVDAIAVQARIPGLLAIAGTER